MLASCELMAFVSVTDVDRARSFYEGILGLPLVEESPFALIFDANGTTLRVTPVQGLAPAPSTVLGWVVADVAGTVRQLAERGLVFARYPHFEQSDEGIWEAPGGARIAWFQDPDGNILSLTQFPSGEASRA